MSLVAPLAASHVARRLTPAAALVLAAACADRGALPTAPHAAAAPDAARAAAAPDPGQPIAGQYIVVFRDEVTDVEGKTKEKLQKANGRLRHQYRAALRGFAGELSDAPPPSSAPTPTWPTSSRTRWSPSTPRSRARRGGSTASTSGRGR
jgi:hypothetical protein